MLYFSSSVLKITHLHFLTPRSHTHLSLTLQSNMSWRNRIVKMYKKASKPLNILKCVKHKVDRSTLTCLYKTLIRPLMEYEDVIWNNCHNFDLALLDNVQYEAARVATRAIKGTSSARLHDELACEPLSIRRELHKLSQLYKIVKNLPPRYLTEILLKLSSERTHFRLRSRENFIQTRCRTSTFQKSFFSISNH